MSEKNICCFLFVHGRDGRIFVVWAGGGFLLCGLEVLDVGHEHQLSFHSGKMYDMLDEHAYLYGFVDTDLVPCQFISSSWSASS